MGDDTYPQLKDSYILSLDSRINDLTLIASWASMIGLGRVRDHCREAIAEIKVVIKNYEEVRDYKNKTY